MVILSIRRFNAILEWVKSFYRDRVPKIIYMALNSVKTGVILESIFCGALAFRLLN